MQDSAAFLPALACVMQAREDELLNAYDEWLYYERKLLHIERWGKELHGQTLALVPASRAAAFHFPLWPARWEDRPKPSTRAKLMLETIGCEWRDGEDA